jgi:hypothetical protein
MKKTIHIFKLGLLSLGLLLGSCANDNILELDLTENPNALSPSQADPDFLLNSIQVNYGKLMEDFGTFGAEMVRVDQFAGRDYANAFSPVSFDGLWIDSYQSILQDIRVMQPLAEEAGLSYHIAVGEFIEAHILLLLVDYFGDIPYSESMDATNLNPVADSGSDVYAAALALLDQAAANFADGGTAEPQNDFFYNGDASAWIKAVNTLKIKAYMTTNLVDGSSASAVQALVSAGNYITDTADDLNFYYGSNAVQPDTRSPRYGTDYTATGGGSYRSNWIMNNMLESADPRRLYYFYRQVANAPGNGAPANEETLDCSVQTAPLHYEGFSFCSVPNGYWGRDHGNAEGIPPDTFSRTLTGVYPAGGKYDDGSAEPQGLVSGLQGAGITPILHTSMVNFWLAELAYKSGNLTEAKAQMMSGLEASMKKVTNFYDSGDDNLERAISEHAAGISSAFDAAASDSDKMDIIAEQFLISLYGNGAEGYNFYRRTGFPTTLQPNLEPNPGGFIRSFYYPSNYANNNANVTQKTGAGVQVFWDTNPASPGFPAAN